MEGGGGLGLIYCGLGGEGPEVGILWRGGGGTWG